MDTTEKELQEFRAWKEQKELEAKRRDNRSAYKALVDEAINDTIPELIGLSEALAEQKAAVYDRFRSVIDLKIDIFGVKDGGQWSHTFTNSNSTARIKLGCNTLDNYDDTAEMGVQIVKDYISSLAGTDVNAKSLVDMVLKLLQKDRNSGHLKASRVLQLEQLAMKTGNSRFLEGVQIIKEAYRPEESRKYISAEIKNQEGGWVSIPLGITLVDEPKKNKSKNNKTEENEIL